MDGCNELIHCMVVWKTFESSFSIGILWHYNTSFLGPFNGIISLQAQHEKQHKHTLSLRRIQDIIYELINPAVTGALALYTFYIT